MGVFVLSLAASPAPQHLTVIGQYMSGVTFYVVDISNCDLLTLRSSGVPEPYTTKENVV